MLGLEVATNAPRSVPLAGGAYGVSALLLRQWGAVHAWLLDRVPAPRPLDEAGLDPSALTPEITELLKFARDLALAWPPRVASRAWFVVLESADGGRARLAWEALRVHRPGFTKAEAQALVAAPPGDAEWE